MRITTLIENMPDTSEKLKFEHGFSVWIEADGKKILFDTGQSGEFLNNAEALKIDLSEVDFVVLSHGHYDHTGGVPALLRMLKTKTPFYVGKEFFSPKYKQLEDGSFKYNGNPFERDMLEKEDSWAEVRFVKAGMHMLSEKLFLFKNFPNVSGFEEHNPKFFVKVDNTYLQDEFVDEIVLGILTEEGMVLVAGCSHVGIVNIVEQVKKVLRIPVVAVLGGTHLVEAGEERLKKTVEAFKANGIEKIAVSHCTGEAGMTLLQKEFSEGFVLNHTGTVLEFK